MRVHQSGCFVRVFVPGEVAERHRKKVLFDTVASVCSMIHGTCSLVTTFSISPENEKRPLKNCCPISGDAPSSDALALTEPLELE
mgnify:CR=1 FL=1